MNVQRLMSKARLAGAMAAILTGLLSGCGGQSYMCGNASDNHCYGVVSWSGNPTGLMTEITAVTLTSGNIFIDDEAWLIDYYASGDAINGAYWVEAGEINEGYGTDYFWADNTANDGFMSYDLGPVLQSDIDHGNGIAYEINQDSRTPSQWNVAIWRASSGAMLYSASSTDNPMTPNTVLEGQELSGEQDAQAPIAFFSNNTLIEGTHSYLRTDDGTVTANHPPNAGWWFSMKASQTTNGDLFFTDCC
jgi:hypothetical protein